MAVKFGNNAATLLASNASSSATVLTVSDGSVFPTLSGADYTYVTLEDVNSNREIVKLTAISGNELTVVRAQDGSSARAFSTSDKCELRITAALLNAVSTETVNGTSARFKFTATANQTTFSGSDDNSVTLAYNVGYIDLYLSGIRLIAGSDYTASNGTSIVLAAGASVNDIIEIVSYGTFVLADIAINDMTDVNTAGIADGSILAYDNTDSRFEKSTILSQSSSGIAVVGNITATGTVDGRDVATDGTKLDGIEASADVTDTANVTAAGALMDSELTSIASVKALNQGVATGDSPTFVGLNASGNLTLDAAGDIILDADGDDIRFKEAGNEWLKIRSGSVGPQFISTVSDHDMSFKGTDGSTLITALTLDMSDAGAATFASTVTSTGLTVDTSAGQLDIEALGGSSVKVKSSGSLKIEATGGSIDLINGSTEVLSTASTGVNVTGALTATVASANPKLKAAYNASNYIGISHEKINVQGGGVGLIIQGNGVDRATFASGGGLTLANGSLTIPDYVIHAGNTSTKFGFGSANTMNFISNGSDRLTIANSYAVFNDAGTDYDFRVESNNSTHALFVQGNTGYVGLGLVPTHNFNLQSAGAVEARFQSTDNDCSLQISSNADETHVSDLLFMSGTSGRGSIAYHHNTTAASQNMIFKTGDLGVTAMTISGTGATTFSSTDDTRLYIKDTGDSSTILIRGDGANSSIGNDSNHPISFTTNGTARLTISNSGAISTTASVGNHFVINENGVDSDFRVETNGNANMIATDGANNRVGIGRVAVSNPLEVAGAAQFFSGIQLGGSGSANNMDDYEEGSWTPVIKAIGTGGNNATYTIAAPGATYTKVGRLVTVHTYISGIDINAITGGTYITLHGFPFQATNYADFTIAYKSGNWSTSGNIIGGYVQSGASYAFFMRANGAEAQQGSTDVTLTHAMITITYQAS